MLTQRLHLAGLRRAPVRQEALGHPDRPHPPRAHLPRKPLAHPHELQRAAAEVQHAAVGQRGRVHRRQVAVPRLLLAAQHADRQARPRSRPRQEVRRVLRVADRARRDRVDRPRGGGRGRAGARGERHRRGRRRRGDPSGWGRWRRCELDGRDVRRGRRIRGLVQEARCPAEMVEHVERRQRSLDRLLPQPAGGRHPFADAHRLVDLVGALPPPVRRGEHHEPERVRAEVDHGEPLASVHPLRVFPTAADSATSSAFVRPLGGLAAASREVLVGSRVGFSVLARYSLRRPRRPKPGDTGLRGWPIRGCWPKRGCSSKASVPRLRQSECRPNRSPFRPARSPRCARRRRSGRVPPGRP